MDVPYGLNIKKTKKPIIQLVIHIYSLKIDTRPKATKRNIKFFLFVALFLYTLRLCKKPYNLAFICLHLKVKHVILTQQF